jgi:hypothetical protein
MPAVFLCLSLINSTVVLDALILYNGIIAADGQEFIFVKFNNQY